MRKKNNHASKKNKNSRLKLDKSFDEIRNTQKKLLIEELFDEAKKKYEGVQKMGFELKLFAFEALKEEGSILFQKSDYSKAVLKFIEVIFTKALSIYKKSIIENDTSFDNENFKNTSLLLDDKEKIIQENILKSLLNISISYIKLNDFENALHISNECLRINPENSKALYRRGIARSKLYPSDPIQIKSSMYDLKHALEL